MLTRDYIVELLPLGKNNTAIVHTLQFFSHIVDRSRSKAQATIAPSSNSTVFAQLAIFALCPIDNYPFISLQPHHSLGHIHLYFSAFHVYIGCLVGRIRFDIKSSAQHTYIQAGSINHKSLFLVTGNAK